MAARGYETFSRLAEQLAAWASAAGYEGPLEQEGRSESPGLRLSFTRIGWSRPSSTGRDASGRQLTAEYLLTAEAADVHLADGLLADLVAVAEGFVASMAPVPPDDPLWGSLNQPPRPALRAGLTFEARPPAASAARIEQVMTTFELGRALTGRVVLGGQPIAGAAVRVAGGGATARTDTAGRFAMPHWSGQPLIVNHRNQSHTVIPAPGATSVEVTLPAET